MHSIMAVWMLGCSELLVGRSSPIAGTFIADMLHGVDPFGEHGFAAKMDSMHCLPHALVFGLMLATMMMPKWIVKTLTSIASFYELAMNALVVRPYTLSYAALSYAALSYAVLLYMHSLTHLLYLCFPTENSQGRLLPC
jgi:hypothetical protein